MASRARLPLLAGRPRPAACAVLTCAALSLAPAAGEDDPVVPDRPTFSNGTIAVERGDVQLEAGVSLARDGAAESWSFGEALFRIGIYESVELRIGGGTWLAVDTPAGDRSGVSDPQFGIKIELVDYSYRTKPESAVIVETTLPVGSSAAGAPGWQPSAALALAWELGPDSSLGAYAGAARALADGERFTQLFAALSVAHVLGSRASLFAELYGLSDRGPDAGSAWFATGGVTIAVDERTAVDLYGEQRLDGTGPRYRLGAGLSRRF